MKFVGDCTSKLQQALQYTINLFDLKAQMFLTLCGVEVSENKQEIIKRSNKKSKFSFFQIRL